MVSSAEKEGREGDPLFTPERAGDAVERMFVGSRGALEASNVGGVFVL